jgi:hypothetical protein
MDKFKIRTSKDIKFWTPVDPIVEYYIQNNKSLQRISNLFEYIFVCSNGAEEIIKTTYGKRSKILLSDNHMTLKGKVLYDFIRNDDYGTLIRLDADAIVFNLDWLLKLIYSTNYQKAIVVGFENGLFRDLYKTSEIFNLDYKFICGMCNITTKCAAKLMDFSMFNLDVVPWLEFDACFTILAHKFASFIPRRLVEISENYTHTAPVWHPPQLCRKQGIVIKDARDYYDRIPYFNKALELYHSTHPS